MISIIGSNWLLHMAVLSCTVIGRVDVVEPWLRSHEYQTRKINGGDHGITWRDIFNAKVLLKCCSELLTQWYVYFLCRFERPVSIHSSTGFIFLGTACMFWFKMNNIRDNRQASKDERFSSSSSIEIFRNPIGTINKIHKITTAAITELAFEAVKSSLNYLTSSPSNGNL